MQRFLKYADSAFNVAAGAASLAGTIKMFADGVTFTWALLPVIAMSLLVMLQLRQMSRVRRLKAGALSVLAESFKNIGFEDIEKIRAVANRPGVRAAVLELLEDVAKVEPGPAERYWIYVGLGVAGGHAVKRQLTALLREETSDFARKGITDALTLLGRCSHEGEIGSDLLPTGDDDSPASGAGQDEDEGG